MVRRLFCTPIRAITGPSVFTALPHCLGMRGRARVTLAVVLMAWLGGCGNALSPCSQKEREFYDLGTDLMECAASDPELTDFLIGFGIAPGAGPVRSCGEVAEDLRQAYEGMQQFGGTDLYPTYESYLNSLIANGRQAYEMLCQQANPPFGE